jgi:hypothetical protein
MLARRAITLEEEIAEIDAILKPLVKETAPELVATLGIGTDAASALLVTAATTPDGCTARRPSRTSAAPRRSMPAAARANDAASTEVVIAKPTPLCGTS